MNNKDYTVCKLKTKTKTESLRHPGWDVNFKKFI